MRKLYAAVVLILVIVSFTGCRRPVAETTEAGTPSGDNATAVIGAAGGSLSIPGGRLTLTVPAGALASDTTIMIQEITNMAFGGLGTAYSLEPDGTVFSQPVTLTFKAGTDDLAKLSIGGMGIAFQDEAGYWKRLPGAVFDEAAGTLSVTTDHFSPYAPVAVTLLKPLSATVKPGERVELELTTCYPVNVSTDPEDWRGYHCDDYWGTEDVTDWAVNGVSGGNAAVGTIKGIMDSARYTAPAQQPTPSTVNASAKLTNGQGIENQNVELYSQITVSGPGDFAGTIDIDWTFSGQTFTIAIDDATLTLKDDGLDETNYTMSGTAKISPTSFEIGGNIYTLTEPAAKAFSEDYGFKVRKIPEPAVRWGYAESWNFASGDSPWQVIVNFQTKTGFACGQVNDVPIPDLETLDGQYTMDCMEPAYGGTAVWEFTKQ